MELTIDQSDLISQLINDNYKQVVTALELQVTPHTFAISSEDENPFGEAGNSSARTWYYGTLTYNQVQLEGTLQVVQSDKVIIEYIGSESSDGDQASYSGMLFNQIKINGSDAMPEGINIVFSGLKLENPLKREACSYSKEMGISFLEEKLTYYKELDDATQQEAEEAGMGCLELGDVSACAKQADLAAKSDDYKYTIECIEKALSEAEEAEDQRKAAEEQRQAELEKEQAEKEKAAEEQAKEDAEARERQDLIDFQEVHGIFCSELTIEELFEIKEATEIQIDTLKEQTSEWKMLVDKARKERDEQSAEAYIAAYGWNQAIDNNHETVKFLDGKMESIGMCEESREAEVERYKKAKEEEKKKKDEEEKAAKEKAKEEFEKEIKEDIEEVVEEIEEVVEEIEEIIEEGEGEGDNEEEKEA